MIQSIFDCRFDFASRLYYIGVNPEATVAGANDLGSSFETNASPVRDVAGLHAQFLIDYDYHN